MSKLSRRIQSHFSRATDFNHHNAERYGGGEMQPEEFDGKYHEQDVARFRRTEEMLKSCVIRYDMYKRVLWRDRKWVAIEYNENLDPEYPGKILYEGDDLQDALDAMF